MDVYGDLLERPEGPSAFLKDSIRNKSISALLSGNGSAINFVGTSYFAGGTVSHPITTNTSRKTKTRRWVNTSAATAGAVAFHRPPVGEFSRDDGFEVCHVCGITSLVAGNRWFSGISDIFTSPTNVDPLASTNFSKIGLALNSNTGNLSLIHNVTGIVPTVIPLGASFPINVTDIWKLELVCWPGGNVTYIVTNLNSLARVTGVLSTNIPPLTTLLGKLIWGTNNATASAFAMDVARLYSET